MIIKNALILLSFFLFIGCGGTSSTVINQSDTNSTEVTQNGVTVTSYERGFINVDECNVIVDKVFLNICYDNSLKVAKAVSYTLDGTLVHQLNIVPRPSFYSEIQVELTNRAKYSDYTGSGYDRGHLAPDASFDWSQESLDATYSLANIIPQVPVVNQQMWVDVENYERTKAVDLGTVNVLNIVKYSSTPTRIGANQIAVSDGYFKVLYKDAYKECFYYANDLNATSVGDTLALHQVNCNTVAY